MSKKELLPIVRDLRTKGWAVSERTTGRGHKRITSPAGHVLTLPSTPSDWRGIKNLKADIRRIERERT